MISQCCRSATLEPYSWWRRVHLGVDAQQQTKAAFIDRQIPRELSHLWESFATHSWLIVHTVYALDVIRSILSHGPLGGSPEAQTDGMHFVHHCLSPPS